MTAQPGTGFSIVVGFKFGDGGTLAFEQAARLAQQIPTASLHLVHVFETPLSQAAAHEMIGHLSLYANEKSAFLGGLNGRTAGVHVRSGDVALEIVQLANDTYAQLIVLGAEPGAVRPYKPAGTIEQVMKLASCPVLVAAPKPAPVAPGPIIEPPCPDCVAARMATQGKDWWCARHSTHAHQLHTYSYQRELPFATYDSQLGPTGGV